VSTQSEYEALQGLNWSRLRLLGLSPLHFRNGFGDDSTAFRLGTAAHAATLEPERFAEDFIVYEGKRDNRIKVWQEFQVQAARQGKEILSPSEHTEAVAIAAAVRGHSAAAGYLTGGKAEHAMTWKLGPFDCKGRADYVGSRAIVDVKTTQSAHPRDFAYSCKKYGYFGQAAWYSDGFFKSTGVRLPFVFIAVEKKPPYMVTVFRVPEHVLAAGRELYLTYLAKLAECQRTGNWHGYTVEPEVDLQLPESFNPEVM
jgi:hypothetical protein